MQQTSKGKTVVLQTPKTCVKSKSYIKHIKTHLNKKNLFDISFKKSDIIINNKDKIINDMTITNYISNKKHIEISKVIVSFIIKYHNNFSVKYACLENEIGNPILYVFLLPFVSIDNYYIIKVGYTKNIIKRYEQLKKEFNVEDIYLIYVIQITGEHIELNVHKNIKKTFESSIYSMKKKKSEKNIISEETYKFSWILFKNILNIIYRTYIEMNNIRLLELENEAKKLENEGENIKLQPILKDKENEAKKLDIELKDKEKECKNIKLQQILAEIELLKLKKG
jgi:hypothetical protein